FASLKIRPAARQLDSTAAFPTDLYPEMAARGLLGITIPEKWVGVGADTQSYALVMEEMSVG
ncbi:MAG: acyl-CoA dehydrogenase family protein, partial [Desulfobacterales bacterium]